MVALWAASSKAQLFTFAYCVFAVLTCGTQVSWPASLEDFKRELETFREDETINGSSHVHGFVCALSWLWYYAKMYMPKISLKIKHLQPLTCPHSSCHLVSPMMHSFPRSPLAKQFANFLLYSNICFPLF